MSLIDRLVLGTAAFVIPGYRLSGRPMPSEAEARHILEAAYDGGIRYFDTAAAYGDGAAERLLGETGLPSEPGVSIISKARPSWRRPGVSLLDEYDRSVARLSAEPTVYLLHAEADQHRMAYEPELEARVFYRGVSVYDPVEAKYARRWAKWLQYPASPWDLAIRPEPGGPTRQVRSVFLRGLLLRGPDAWPLACPLDLAPYMRPWQRWNDTLTAGQKLLPACLRYAAEGTGADFITIGVGSLEELDQVLEAAAAYEPGDGWAAEVDVAFADVPRLVWPSVTGAQG